MRQLSIVSALLLLLGACTDGGSGSSSQPAGACVNTTDCPDGFRCLEETCKQIECTTSDECGIDLLHLPQRLPGRHRLPRRLRVQHPDQHLRAVRLP